MVLDETTVGIYTHRNTVFIKTDHSQILAGLHNLTAGVGIVTMRMLNAEQLAVTAVIIVAISITALAII